MATREDGPEIQRLAERLAMTAQQFNALNGEMQAAVQNVLAAVRAAEEVARASAAASAELEAVQAALAEGREEKKREAQEIEVLKATKTSIEAEVNMIRVKLGLTPAVA